MATFPTYVSMMNPLLISLKQLGGSATIEELVTSVAELMKIPDDQLEILQKPEKGGPTKFEYRLAWTRTYLKKYGLIDNSSKGVWALTAAGRNVGEVDGQEIARFVREKNRIARGRQKESEIEDEEKGEEWQEDLLGILLEMEPSAFERLTQRLLRVSGFIQVVVTGRSGDGGIDGKGIMRLGGLLSFHVYFQCKRYKGSVSSGTIRDFRGAMAGRADKGLVITTGTFTKDARTESVRDGAPPIDLIDGDRLVELLQEYSLGVEIKKVSEEEVVIDKSWFEGI